MKVTDVAYRVQEGGLRNVVITGGEPLLQMTSLAALVRNLRSSDKRVEIETNGTIAPDPGILAQVTQWNVSPKLANSGEVTSRREKADVLRVFAKNPRAFFKFVVCQADELDEVSAFIPRYRIAPDRVVVMPEGTTAEVVTARMRELIPGAIARGFRVSPRLHIMLWGNQPGT